MAFLFTPPAVTTVPINGSAGLFPVHRIYCVGKNYAEHIREMGSDPAREAPCFFLKPTDALVLDGRMPYPPGTANLHYEGELVLALGKGGRNIPVATAASHLFGYALGLDMTRRDLQTAAGRQGMPWDTGKAFDHSAPIGERVAYHGQVDLAAIEFNLRVNGQAGSDTFESMNVALPWRGSPLHAST